MFSMIPVCLQADGAEYVATWDGHRVPEILLTKVAGVLVKRHGDSLLLFPLTLKR